MASDQFKYSTQGHNVTQEYNFNQVPNIGSDDYGDTPLQNTLAYHYPGLYPNDSAQSPGQDQQMLEPIFEPDQQFYDYPPPLEYDTNAIQFMGYEISSEGVI